MNTVSPHWREISVWFTSWQAAQHAVTGTLRPALRHQEAVRSINRWWFLRKGREWRVRYEPGSSAAEEATGALDETLQGLLSQGGCTHWAHTVYEPPTAAFGGPLGLDTAHRLFHTDSRHVLDHLATGAGHRRELGVLLATAMLRAASRDWYDQGHVWDVLAQHRTAPAAPSGTDQVRVLLTADPVPSSLGVKPEWFSAFERAGAEHFDLDRRGKTTRGLNAVLAHHILYAWNRLGLSEPIQGALAHTAAHVIFHDHRSAAVSNTASRKPQTANVDAVTTDTAGTLALDPVALRNALADRILSLGTFRTAAVEDAFRTVPREVFLPGVELTDAYAPKVVVTQRAADGTAVSSASSPNIVAGQAEDLDIRPGHTILEIGAATGINAALLAEITGPGGRVVTIEIDQDLTDGARTALDNAGYTSVATVCGDGAAGWAKAAPYDRIIVTAGAWDIPSPWWDQLAPGGRIVVPVRLHGSGLTRSLALDLQPTGELLGSHTRVCGFVPMRGTTQADSTTTIALTDQIVLNTATVDDPDQAALTDGFAARTQTHWTGIRVTDHEPVEHLDLWLATTSPGFARLSVNAQARTSGIADPALRWAGATLFDGGTLAYLTARPHGPISREIGITTHGPDSHRLTTRLLELLQEWNHTRPTRPLITAHRADTPDDRLGTGVRIDRPDTRFTIAW